MPECIARSAEDTVWREEREVHARPTGVGCRRGEALRVRRERNGRRRRLRRRRGICAHAPPLGRALFHATSIVHLTLKRLDRSKRQGVTSKMEILREVIRVVWSRERIVYVAIRALVEDAILAGLLTQRSHELGGGGSLRRGFLGELIRWLCGRVGSKCGRTFEVGRRATAGTGTGRGCIGRIRARASCIVSRTFANDVGLHGNWTS